jgi:hypothetical protein
MARQPEVKPWLPLNEASHLASLEILFSIFPRSESLYCIFPLH